MKTIQAIKTVTMAAFAAAALIATSHAAKAYTSEDGSLDLAGYVENRSFWRTGAGISKMENTGQVEFTKRVGDMGLFSNISFSGTFRVSYNAAYQLNSDEFGNSAGGPVNMPNSAGVTLATAAPGIAALGAPNFTQASVPWGGGAVPTGDLGVLTTGNPFAPNGTVVPFPGFGFNLANNPNDGLKIVDIAITGHNPNQVTFASPVRPCDKDSRGCIGGYMDKTRNELICRECNSRWDFLRELYADASVNLANGDILSFRVGRQQVVWGRTDLFRVLDVINPVDYSRQNIYDELEDIRMPQWILNSEYRMGATGIFDDLNVNLMWNFDQFRPSDLGQGGEPYSILGAGDQFRALSNLWTLGGTVGNFAGCDALAAAGLAVVDPGILANGLAQNCALATDFGPGVLGIRRVKDREWSISNSQIGTRVEGVLGGVGFSLNYLNYISQLPTLDGGILSTNPFTGQLGDFAFLPAFDIRFPRVNLYGGSADVYWDLIETVFRFEAAYTSGEEFADSLSSRLFSESDVIRYVIGIDRPTFIPFLNQNRTFLISGQLFGTHLLDHQEISRPNGKVGFADWEENWIATLLIQGFYMNDRLTPRLIYARDFKSFANTISPGVDWLITDNWQVGLAANVKFGGKTFTEADVRDGDPFGVTPIPGNEPPQGIASVSPIGRFKSGPLGMADREDEVQLTVRYRW